MDNPATAHRIDRRRMLGLGLGVAAGSALAACGGVSTTGGGSGAVDFLSTQFTPVEEKQRFEKILGSRVSVKVAYNAVEAGVFASTITSQVDSGKVKVSLLGGLHGDLAPHAERLVDLQDLTDSLSGRGFNADLLELGKLGGSTAKYVPWMQATNVLAIKKEATQWLPTGADPEKLTYDQLLDWVIAGRKATGKPVFGFPAGSKGLYHRFFQGFLLPSFTGGQITTFHSAEAVTAWQWMKDLWANTAPASTNYDYMQEPLQRGEVLMAWDHVARLTEALTNAADWLVEPAPAGPKGRAYLLAICGLAIPRGAPDQDKAKEVIKALTLPDTQIDVLRQNAFFPVVRANQPADLLGTGVGLEAHAVQLLEASPDAVVALPPVGLGAKDAEVTQIFQNCFKEICLDGRPIPQVLDDQAKQLDAILAEAKVPCWKPDPVQAVCRVG